MIDLSHLTEEEQEMIMAVLRRDAELKKAEEERVRNLEKILSGGPQTDGKLKYLTGEWFYEAKSLRHTDKIHGSEIILASMKQGKAASLDGSLRVDRPRMSSSRSSDIVAPQKPARCFEAQQPKQINEAEKENRDSSVCSPRLPRRNPFNRASLIVVEPPENNSNFSSSRYPESVETEPVPPPKSRPAGDSSQTSGGSVTSEGSSVAFRPVPKKRTFLSRRTGSQTESACPGVDGPAGSAAGVVPAPRRSLQQASSGSSERSRPRSPGEEPSPPQSAAPASGVISQPAPPPGPADGRPLQPPRDASQRSSHPSPEGQRHASSEKSDRPAVCSRSSGSARRKSLLRSEEQDHQTQRQHPGLNLFSLPTVGVRDEEIGSHTENPIAPEELSLPQSIVGQDPPISYDLHFIDKSDQVVQKPSQTHVFKLSTQATSPNGDEEDSIAKVLDWFSRSVDSSEWLNSDEGPEVTKVAGVSRLRGEEPVAKTIRKKKESQIKRQTTEEDKEFRGPDRRGSRELIEGKVKTNAGAVKLLHGGENRLDENQPDKISHLKSFWEKSNVGPKILVSKVVTPGDKGQKPAQQSAERESEILSAPRMHSERGIQDIMTASRSDEREKRLAISPHTDVGSSFHHNDQKDVDNLVTHSSQRRNNDLMYTSDYVKLLSSPQAADRSSETEPSRGAKCSPVLKTADGLESESVAAVEPNPSPDRTLETREELLTVVLAPLPDEEFQTRASPDSEKFSWSRSSPYMDSNDVQITAKAHIYSEATDDRKGRDSEDKSTSPKAKEETSSKDRAHSSHSNRQESTAERIKQLKSFWEQERNRPIFYSGKPKPSEDGKVSRGANQAKLNKRFTKSEYDLSSLGKESDSDEEHADRNPPSFTVVPLNQRLEKVSPTLNASRSQFNTLRHFWDEATLDSKGSFPRDKPKSPKRKEPTGAQLPSFESRGGDAEIYRVAAAVEKTRASAMKSSPSHQSRSKSPHDRQTGSGSRVQTDGKISLYVSAEPGPQQRQQSRRNPKDPSREDKPLKPQSSPGREIRPPKSRKDSFGVSRGRSNSMRRATSMFALSAPDEADPSQLRMDVSPVHSHSRKPRQSADKGGASRRSSEEALTPPRARAFVPTDYRHYLGMSDGTGVHTSLAPAAKVEGSEGKSGYELSLGGPVRASTPVSGEERHSRRDSRAGQRPLWTAYSSSDTGMESSLSSTSESWSSSRKNREKDDEQNPVKKALWRAEIRPKNLAKSMEDITGPLSPRQERRPDPASELRRISNVSSIPSSSSSLFSDSDHLKKMSKSVPSFLQNEDADGGSDAASENGSHPGQLSMGSSMSNINRSSGMKSVSPLSGSVTTMYSGDFGNVEVQGHIQFSINYIHRLREFHIFVAECGDLAAVEPKRGRSDPYVKSYLVPDKANLGKKKTSVKKKTLNPTFNEILRYRVRMEYLRTQTLILSVWHHDTFGRNSFLGEADVDLSKWDFDHTQMNYLALKARATPTLAPSNGRGEMRVAIRFLPQIIHSEGKDGPSTSEIHIWVKECKNLPPIRATIDPYVKCFMLPDTSRKSRQKTRVLRRTVDPVFNHTMVYDGIRDVDLTEACVELTVWDRDRLASNLLGGLRLGAGTGRSYGAAVDWMDSSPFEVALWERMTASPNEWVEDALPLRVLNSSKTKL